MKLLPLTVSVKAGPAAGVVFGTRLVIEGTGLLVLLTVKVRLPDVPPPGAGLNTVTAGVPAEAMSAAPIAAWIWPELMNVVVRSEPAQRTIEPLMKFEPFTVSVKAEPPAAAEFGDRFEAIGTGLPVGADRTTT